MIRAGSKRLKTLMRRKEGIATLEFALLAPVFLLFVMGTIEYSMIMFTMVTMESATDFTARSGKTGYTTNGVSRQQYLINSISSRTAGLLNPALFTITMTIYPAFNNVGQPEPCIPATKPPPCSGAPGVGFVDVNGNGVWDADMGESGAGNAGDVVVYTVTYPWQIMTPLVSAVIGTTFPITARTVVKNEPFNN